MTAFQLPGHWPEPAEPARAVRLAEQLPARGRPPAARALIACLGGNSAYLAALALGEGDCFAALLERGPDPVVQAALSRLGALDFRQPRSRIAAALRQAKRQVALAAAVADIGGIWNLARVTEALTRLAESALAAATRHLLWSAAARSELVLADPERPETGCGLVVLGMGKLGARELNYSSDIDLILLYDPAAHPAHRGLPRVFTRLAGDLVRLMEARDEGGYVFRTDLRLRPDPAATPLAVSLPSAIAYYESLGQTWERAAMIKARPVAGDLACGEAFLAAIRPFIWRRHLDFAAIGDIRAMKRRIDQRAGAAGDLLGHDLKLGHGGIREIEFLAQSMQLVWGGRAAELRDPTTLGTLAKLAAGNYMPAGLAGELAESYRLLRRVEHRLQMQDDRQTHSLPSTKAGFEMFARFMDQPALAFAKAIGSALGRTRAAFEDWFAEPGRPSLGGPGLGSEFGGPELGNLVDTLGALGFADPRRAAAIIQGWQQRSLRALRSDRAQALLGEMLPPLLAAAAEQRDPTQTLIRFDELLARQSAGVHLLSLLVRNPPLLGRIAFVLNAAPSLAQHLALVPAALEGLLVPEVHGETATLPLRLLDASMRGASGTEEAVRHARPLVRGEEFRLALAQMDGRLDVDAAGLARSMLADRVINRMLDQVQREHRARFGRVQGGGMIVVALGKAGSRDMMAGSDLDLMLVYDHPETATESALPRSKAGAGSEPRPRPLPASQYYIRLAHSLIAALSAPGAEGPLYALDMRLRPSGSKGPVAVSLAALRRYHGETSWTWERMALCRARVVAGPPPLRRRVRDAIAEAIARPGVMPQTLLRDAGAMRARIAAELPPRGPLDIKLIEGGLLEVEFAAQIMQLIADDARARHPTTRLALRRLARRGILSKADARVLIDAERFWRAAQSMLRILYGTALPRTLAEVTSPALDALLQGVAASGGADLASLDGLRDRMQQVSRDVHALFVRLIVAPTIDYTGR